MAGDSSGIRKTASHQPLKSKNAGEQLYSNGDFLRGRSLHQSTGTQVARASRSSSVRSEVSTSYPSLQSLPQGVSSTAPPDVPGSQLRAVRPERTPYPVSRKTPLTPSETPPEVVSFGPGAWSPTFSEASPTRTPEALNSVVPEVVHPGPESAPFSKAMLRYLTLTLLKPRLGVENKLEVGEFIYRVQKRARLDETTLLVASHYMQHPEVQAYLHLQTLMKSPMPKNNVHLHATLNSEDRAVRQKILHHELPIEVMPQEIAVATMMVAHKSLHDHSYTSASWANTTRMLDSEAPTKGDRKLGPVQPARINLAERTLCQLLGYKLIVENSRVEELRQSYQAAKRN